MSRNGLRRPSGIFRPWYHGWNVVAATVVCQAAIVGSVLYAFTFFVVPISDEFGVGKGQVMLAITFVSLVNAFISPFVGKAVDRLPIRVLMVVGIVATLVGFLLASQAQNLWVLYLVFAIPLPIGMTCAGALAAQALVSRWFDQRRGLALGFSAMGTSLGGVLLPPVITYLLDQYDWRTVYMYVGVGVALLSLPMVLLFVREPKPSDKPSTQSGAQSASTGKPTQKFWSTAEILKNRDFWLLACWLSPLTLAVLSIQLNLAPIGQELGIDAGGIAMVASFFALASIFGKLFWGTLVDMFDDRYSLWLSAAFICFPLSMLMFATSIPLFLGFIFLIGLGFGAFMPLMAAVVANRFGPGAVGSVTGLLAPVMLLASFGPPAAGMISDATGSYAMAYIAGAAIILPVFVTTYFMSPVRSPELAEDNSSVEAESNIS